MKNTRLILHDSPLFIPLQRFLLENIPDANRFGTDYLISNSAALLIKFQDGFLIKDIIGGIIIDDFCPITQTLEINAVRILDKLLFTKEFIWYLYNYIYNELNCRVSYARVSSHNTQMLKTCRHFGYQETVLPHKRGINDHEYVFWLTREQWNRMQHKFNPNREILNERQKA